MSTQEGQTKIIFTGEDQNPPKKMIHPVLHYPVVLQLIRAFKPELLADTPPAIRQLDRIAAYLSRDNQKITDPDLDQFLPPEFVTTLYGLKTLLRKRNPNIVNWTLEEHKDRFRDLIEQALEEE